MAESRVVEMRAASGATADSPGAAGPAVSSVRREPAAAAEAFEEAFIEAEEPQLITSSTMHARAPSPTSSPRRPATIAQSTRRAGLLGLIRAGACPNLLQRSRKPISAADETPEYQRFSSLIPT